MKNKKLIALCGRPSTSRDRKTVSVSERGANGVRHKFGANEVGHKL